MPMYRQKRRKNVCPRKICVRILLMVAVADDRMLMFFWLPILMSSSAFRFLAAPAEVLLQFLCCGRCTVDYACYCRRSRLPSRLRRVCELEHLYTLYL